MESSEKLKEKFLIVFTNELIKNSVQKEIVKLENILNEKREDKEKIIFIPEIQNIPQIKQEKISPPKIKPIQRKVQEIPRPAPPRTNKFISRQMLFIPEPNLPKHLAYLKPTLVNEISGIDLGKLNPLIRDRAVKIIEGVPDKNIMVLGDMGTRPTNIILTKEEIDEIIHKFSEKAKIPVTEGIYRVVSENLILSAIISEAIGSRFIIKKIISIPNQNKEYQIIPKKF